MKKVIHDKNYGKTLNTIDVGNFTVQFQKRLRSIRQTTWTLEPKI